MKIAAPLILVLVLWAVPAHAAPPREGGSRIVSAIEMPNDIERRSAEIAEEYSEPDGAYANLPMVAAPVVDEDGRMTAYAFLRPRLLLAEEGDAERAHERAHEMLDGFTRAVHTRPLPANGQGFDESGAQADFLALARDTLGAERVRGLDLLGGDMRRVRR